MEALESSRQEVAERLRAKYRERNVPGMFEPQDAGMQAYVYLKDLESCLPDGESAFAVMADLIDPTCHGIEEQEFDGIGAPPRYISRCSNCGQWWDETDGIPRFPAYCPGCGCRVVSDD